MAFLSEIKSVYVAAARLMAAVSNIRVDLLASAGAQMATQPQHMVKGYESLGPVFAICLPEGERGVLSFLSPRSEGMKLETDSPSWMTLEGWLPAAASEATSCFVEMCYEGDIPLIGDVFVRDVDDEFGAVDSTPVEWHLSSGDLSVVEVPLDGPAAGRRKIVIHLRRPPSVLALKSLTLTPV